MYAWILSRLWYQTYVEDKSMRPVFTTCKTKVLVLEWLLAE